MSALDPFISNPAHSVPSEYAGAISASNNAPFPDAGIAQLFELAESSGTATDPDPARGHLAAGAGPALLLPAPAAFFPDICELLSYANGKRFFDETPRDDVTDSPPLFLSNPSFEFTQSVRVRCGVA